MKDSSNEKTKKSGMGVTVTIILIIIILIAFLVSKYKIMCVLKETEFFTHVLGNEPDFVKNYEIPEHLQEKENTIILSPQEQLAETLGLEEDIETIAIQTEPQIQELEQPQQIDQTQQTNTIEEIEPIEQTKTIHTEEKIDEKEKTSVELPPVEIAKTNQHLYFIYINANGSITRKEAIRSVQKTITPLSAALKALLNGPTAEEREKGYVNFIPEGTKLLSVSIQDKTAMINFSEEFSYNQYGVEGYFAQLMQVIYTATTFNTIKDVQFLIEGEKISYLGNDGVWIGSPLSRTDFK